MEPGLPEQVSSPEIAGKIPQSSEEPERAFIPDERKKPSVLQKTAVLSFVLIVFFFLGKAFYRNLGQLGAYSWSIKPSLLILSLAFLIANLAISALAWKRILSLFEVRLPFDQSFKIMFVSGLGKYLPGKIWLYVSQVYLGQRARIPKSVCVFSLLLLFAAYSLAGTLVFVLSLFLWQRFSPLVISGLALATCAILLMIFSPRFLSRTLSFLVVVSKGLKKKLIPGTLIFRGDVYRAGEIILILLADWVVFGVACYLLVNSFYHISASQTVILCGIFAVSSILGIVSFFVPAGLGVREGASSYLLSMFMPIPAAILISLVMRVWMTIGELICFVLALRIKKPKLW
ncbi:MAG: lysylphosphatidylglycerol synthase transmembrane domain-containing protein [Candidatus Zixiibacteriota bacterium]